MKNFTFFYLISLFVLAGCLPNQPQKKGAGACGEKEVFDPNTRSCIQTSITPQPPKNTLKFINIFEDTPTSVNLTYSDANGDLGVGCSVSDFSANLSAQGACSCTAGVCTVQIKGASQFTGLAQFYYYINDPTGTSGTPTMVGVKVNNIDDAPVGTGITPSSPLSLIQDFTDLEIILGYTDAENDLATSCEITLSSSSIFISTPCRCNVAGVCTVSISGTPFKYTSSIEAFTYSVYANGQWSDATLAQYSISNTNDLPTPQSLSPQGTTSEDFTNMSFDLLYDEADDTKPSDCRVSSTSTFVTVPEVSCDCATPNFGKCTLNVDVASAYANINDDTPQIFSLTYELQDAQSGDWVASSAFTFNVLAVNDSPTISGDGGSYNGDENTTFTVTPTNLIVDEGGGVDENAQTISIKVTSSDVNIIPHTGIEIFWGTTQITNNYGNWSTLGDSALSADSQKLSFRLKPNKDITGTVTFTIAIRDSLLATATGTISVSVDDINDPPTLTQVSNICANKVTGYIDNSNCTTNGCIYNDDPTTKAITPKNYGEIYYDFESDLCYYSTGTTAATDWSTLRTTCNFSTTKSEPGCKVIPNSPLNCIGSGTPIDLIEPTKVGSYYYDYTNDLCYISTNTTSNDDWKVVDLYTKIPATCNNTLSGTTDPVKNETPASSKLIYKNTTDNSCWISTGTTTSDWIPLYCPIASGSKSGIIAPRSNADSNKNIIASAKDEYYFDYANGICYRSLASGDENWVIYGDYIKDLSANESASLGNGKNTANILFSNLRLTEGSMSEFATQGVDIEIENLTNSNSGSPYLGNTNLLPLNSNTIELYQSRSDTKTKVKITATPLSADNSVSFELENVTGSLRNEPIEIRFHSSASQYGRAEMKLTLVDNNVTPIKTKTYYFSILVYPVRGNHLGWNKLTSLGDKKSILGTILTNKSVYLKWDKMKIEGNIDEQTPVVDPSRANGDYSAVSISGYNIYRRAANTEFDFSKPLNGTTLISANTPEFTDSKTTTSIIPGVPDSASVYYYTIRGVDSFHQQLIHSGETFSTIRVVVPPPNMAFVHRWMVNREICQKMKKTASEIDSSQNYRCLYSGPGENGLYYDIGVDLLVDQFEASCPYTSAGQTNYTKCGYDWGCIHIDTTPPSSASANNIIYYSRGDGSCYNRDSGVWKSFGALSAAAISSAQAKNTQYPLLPPLVKIKQADAKAVCQLRSNETIYTTPNTLTSSLPYDLPTRKQQMAYSAWASNLTDADIDAKEVGAALNASSKCNGYGANGLNGYTDDPIPASTNLYSLPGSESSNIRSMRTGDPKTLSCVSNFGIQDTIGNVKEWTQDRMMCHPRYSATGVISTTCEAVHSNDSYVGNFCPATSANYIGAVGSGTPPDNSSITAGTVYLNTNPPSGSSGCWIRNTSGVWKEMTKYCPVTCTATDTCVGVGALPPTITPSKIGNYFYNTETNTCYVSVSTNAIPASANWVSTSTSYPVNYAIASIPKPTALGSNNDMYANDPYFSHWVTDGYRGACWDSDSDGYCDDSPIDYWNIQDETFNAGLFIFPIGLPIQRDFKTLFPDSTLNDHLLEIGTTSGISRTALHNDTISINSNNIVQATSNNNCAAMNTGGGYESLSGAGRYNLEMLPCTSTKVDVGFRCSIKIDYTEYDE